MVELLIFAPHEYDQGAPTGFALARDYLDASRLKDPLSSRQSLSANLQRMIYYLYRRYPQRIRIRWVNPWSPHGLWTSFRYRLKGFPCVVINRQEVYYQETLPQLEQRVAELLGQTPDTGPEPPNG